MLTGRLNAPCKGCENRKLGCHSTCELYQKYSKELDAVRKRIRLESDFTDARTKRIFIDTGYTHK